MSKNLGLWQKIYKMRLNQFKVQEIKEVLNFKCIDEVCQRNKGVKCPSIGNG